MFKKKHKLIIEFTDDKFNIKHNFDKKTPLKQLKKLVSGLFNGTIGDELLNNMANNPDLINFCKDMYLKSHPPVKVINTAPIVSPSNVISNFVNQIKGMINE
jgi:hypothetical protein